MTSVSAIISEFVSNIDTDKEYGLAEIKAILSTAFKTVKSANAPVKAVKADKKVKVAKKDAEVSSDNEEKPKKKRVKRERDADGNILKKRAPSAYNLFVKDKIAEVKAENPELNSKEAFKMAIEAWNKQKAEKVAEVAEPAEVNVDDSDEVDEDDN
jgi:hypothetical protein